jgi:hypothetical protein
MLFLNFSSEKFEAFKSNINEAAKQFKGKDVSFLIGDIEASQGAFQVCYLTVPFVFVIIFIVSFVRSCHMLSESTTQFHFSISTF